MLDHIILTVSDVERSLTEANLEKMIATAPNYGKIAVNYGTVNRGKSMAITEVYFEK